MKENSQLSKVLKQSWGSMKKIQMIQKIWAFHKNNWYNDAQNQMKKKKREKS
jgi:hypothetical protein